MPCPKSPNVLFDADLLSPMPLLVQGDRRQKAEGRRKESLYSKLFKLFQLDSYFRHAALESILNIGKSLADAIVFDFRRLTLI